ncbi:hypothetical protein DASC09_062890 [Saccharomycopsis crataegensis]|uniref:DH domain-containing protein n=1 Tax=Saccharomycopsis crataegensis TaxID=43959 RepID=A0AAV5QVH1_9ASCO|nr:hypothetical protein DASC09_062890 [Saccharomycopsis crataegensis]
MAFSRYGSIRSTSLSDLSSSSSAFRSGANSSTRSLPQKHGVMKIEDASLSSLNLTSPESISRETFAGEILSVSEEQIEEFEEKYQLTVTLNGLNDPKMVSALVQYTNKFYGRIENALNVFKLCCLARQKHKTLEVIGLIICDIEQILNISTYFCFLTKDYEDTLFDQIIGLKDETEKVYALVKKMLKYSIFPPIDPKYIKQEVTSVAHSMSVVIMDMISYIIQRLLAFVSIKKSNNTLWSFTKVLQNIDINRKRGFQITQKLEQWLEEKSICSNCSKDILIQPCIREPQSKKKWHINCCVCSTCNQKLVNKDLMSAFLDQSGSLIVCYRCASSNNSQIQSVIKVNSFVRVSSKQQAVSLLKANILETIQELEDENYGYICQEWVQYWRMDKDDLAKYDRNVQKIQSAIFELIHRQQFFVDSAADFLEIGDKYIQDSMESPEELDPGLYDLIFRPVKELRKIHKRLLLSPMTRFLSDQGMIIKNQIFKLYLSWITKSYYAYDAYLIKLAESELILDMDKMKEVSHLQNWIKQQNSAKFDKLLSGEFYYQMIQTKEIMRGLEKLLDKDDPENTIVFQTSMLINKYSFQLHSVLDRAVTRAYISRIQNLEVKRSDVHYKKHAYVRYKSKATNEVLDCCLILLNMCLVITKFSQANSMFIKFAPLIYLENIEYDRVDAKVFISDKVKSEIEPYKFHFRSVEEASNWINIRL